jgi:hypothetical protein
MRRDLRWARILAPVCALAGLPVSAIRGNTAQPLPKPFPEGRYQEMSAKSPFAVATASSAAAAPTPGFAAQLYVDGVARVARTDFVAIKSRDPGNKSVMFLQVGESSADGIKVERVQWSDQLGKSTVDVTKAGEKATLIFDEQQMAKSAPPPMVRVPGYMDGDLGPQADGQPIVIGRPDPAFEAKHPLRLKRLRAMNQ